MASDVPASIGRVQRWWWRSIWAVVTGLLVYGFFVTSHVAALLCGCGIAVSLFVLRCTARPFFGLIEILAGLLLLARAIYAGGMGRGLFSDAFSASFDRFDLNVIALQSYAALFLLVRGLDNVWGSSAGMRRIERISRTAQSMVTIRLGSGFIRAEPRQYNVGMHTAQIGSWLHRQFPRAPRSVREIYPRLSYIGFLAVALLLAVMPKHRVLPLEALWFQLAAAALLWFESNAAPARMKLITEELRQPFKPTTRAKRAVDWVFSWLVLLLAYARVARELLTQSTPGAVAINEFVWAGAAVAGAATIYLIGRRIDRFVANLRTSMMNGPACEEEIKVRRFLRTIAFVLLFLGTLGQMVDVTVFQR